MNTIIIKYDVRDKIVKGLLDVLSSISTVQIIKDEYLTKEETECITEEKTLTAEEVAPKVLFAETFGMWADRDIDLKKIRKERRERRTKYYDNATL